jgi:hypothetical protein
VPGPPEIRADADWIVRVRAPDHGPRSLKKALPRDGSVDSPAEWTRPAPLTPLFILETRFRTVNHFRGPFSFLRPLSECARAASAGTHRIRVWRLRTGAPEMPTIR